MNMSLSRRPEACAAVCDLCKAETTARSLFVSYCTADQRHLRTRPLSFCDPCLARTYQQHIGRNLKATRDAVGKGGLYALAAILFIALAFSGIHRTTSGNLVVEDLYLPGGFFVFGIIFAIGFLGQMAEFFAGWPLLVRRIIPPSPSTVSPKTLGELFSKSAETIIKKRGREREVLGVGHTAEESIPLKWADAYLRDVDECARDSERDLLCVVHDREMSHVSPVPKALATVSVLALLVGVFLGAFVNWSILMLSWLVSFLCLLSVFMVAVETSSQHKDFLQMYCKQVSGHRRFMAGVFLSCAIIVACLVTSGFIAPSILPSTQMTNSEPVQQSVPIAASRGEG